MFQWMFGKRLTPQEQLRKNQRQLERTQRELDREKGKLQQQEKKIISDIKKSAKEGQTKTMNIQARDLIRTRKQVEKFDKMKMQMQAISLRLQTIRSSNEMTNSMANATRILSGLNSGNLNIQQLNKISHEFQKNMDMMDQKQEMMDDIMDDMMDEEIDEDDEEEIDQVVSQVLDEIGIGLNDKLGGLKVSSGINNDNNAIQENAYQRTAIATASGGGASDEDDLQARLNSLKK
ncbi:ESCRT-III subunit protein [Pichia kluyveri]|uniref:ESCRT-III subunit protein n=1 Tax=Pichia kluyveri TaxID=36015 RepID=A0AAV5R262_PICKL|nr:ESCRT-III subunit protein [Pichia kluyveri]